MNNRLIKQMFDACYMAKRTRDMLPPLPEGVQPSYIHYLDCMRELEEKGKQVRISDLSEFLNIPRPGVTRTVTEMEAKGYSENCFARRRPGDLPYRHGKGQKVASEIRRGILQRSAAVF